VWIWDQENANMAFRLGQIPTALVLENKLVMKDMNNDSETF